MWNPILFNLSLSFELDTLIIFNKSSIQYNSTRVLSKKCYAFICRFLDIVNGLRAVRSRDIECK